MLDLNKRKKVIIILLIIFIGILGYYIYNKNIEEVVISESTTTENTENIEKATEETKTKIVVHISGAVNKEGIVELEENSRVADAINKAEGLKEKADMKSINLAYKLEDGMKIYIPTEGEESEENQTNNIVVNSNNQINQKENSKNIEKSTQININTATQIELENLPGIGAATAMKIIEYRKQNKKFNNIEEIKQVKGIGESKYSKIKDMICVK